MTYHSSWNTYEFTAFAESDFGGNVDCGTTFTMPAAATLCVTVTDDDSKLSSDKSGWHDDVSYDHYGQNATIEGPNGHLGNGGQIYMDSYYWVYDQHGNWFQMIEVEQEGSHEDYFTFYTGGGYGVPGAGAQLTVHSKCDLNYHSGLNYSHLDAGEKTPPVPTEICIEAEDMHETGFHIAHGSQASGGEFLKLNCAGGHGDVNTTFKGVDGTYDMCFFFQDENDGQSKIYVKVNGHVVDIIDLNRDSDGGGSDQWRLLRICC